MISLELLDQPYLKSDTDILVVLAKNFLTA